MISVCIATYNGEKFIGDQIRSILPQLYDDDEIIVSDNNSSDKTINVINTIADARIKVLTNHSIGIVPNFENCLKHASGDIIFLCDQDDVWMNDKVRSAKEILQNYDLVLSNGLITNETLKPTGPTIFDKSPPSLNLVGNIFKNSFTGCCMAFNGSVLNLATPFPKGIAMHDWWIGIVALAFSRVYIDGTPRIFYRRHQSNHSSTSEKSTRPIRIAVKDRFVISYQISKLLIKSRKRVSKNIKSI